MPITATYDPEDNKLRLRSTSRLDAETFARVKLAGFIWAPRQELFVAPAWTPERADLCEALADSGEIEDEDTSLVDRAAERAERFETYSERRGADADAARLAVARIADGIPLGQPILVGHHSERHARKDAERIENGMRRAVRMWETSKYWESRAAGAILHAKYKQRPDVRYRRIKGIESDRRKHQTTIHNSEKIAGWWQKAIDTPAPAEQLAFARKVANVDHCYIESAYRRPGGYTGPLSPYDALRDDPPIFPPDEVAIRARAHHAERIARAHRWVAHAELRLAYERAMLAEAGGLAVERTDTPVQVGSRIRVGSVWCVVLRLNQKDGALVSVSTNNRKWPRVVSVEDIAEVEPPAPGAVEAVKAAQKLPPMCNYPGDGFHELTKAEWARMFKDSKGSHVVKATDTHGAHRVRSTYRRGALAPVYLTDEKRKDPPPAEARAPEPEPTSTPDLAPAYDLEQERARLLASNARHTAEREEAAPFEAMRASLKAGVQVVTAPQLFQTPPDLARALVSRIDARLTDGRWLEPSAGTGRLLDAIRERRGHLDRVYAVEINPTLAECVRRRYEIPTVCADFLEVSDPITFDAIVLNPPFANAVDIRHIQRAYGRLAPGGMLAALCAAGPRQEAALLPWAHAHGGEYEPVEGAAFLSEGTSVRVAMVTARRPEEG